jgi:hypothetical protein
VPAVLLVTLKAPVAAQKAEPPLKVACDRAEAIHRAGDTATFKI